MLQDIAERAASKTRPKRTVGGYDAQDVFLDPATISLCMAVVTQVIKLIKYCRSNVEEPEEASMQVAYEMVKYPTKREVNSLKRILRRKMGWRAYWRDGGKTLDALLDTGKEVQQVEVVELWTEV